MVFPDSSGCCQLQAEEVILGFLPFLVLVALGMWLFHGWHECKCEMEPVPIWLPVGLYVFCCVDWVCWVLWKYVNKRKSNLSPEFSQSRIREAEAPSVNDRLWLGEAQTNIWGEHQEEEEEEVRVLYPCFCLD